MGGRENTGGRREKHGRWMDAASACSPLPFPLVQGGYFGPIQKYKCCKWVQEGFIRRKGQSSGRARI